ncbi:MAG: hypothetical protein ACRC1K_20995, partial [Planctomycetia bacterium]
DAQWILLGSLALGLPAAAWLRAPEFFTAALYIAVGSIGCVAAAWHWRRRLVGLTLAVAPIAATAATVAVVAGDFAENFSFRDFAADAQSIARRNGVSLQYLADDPPRNGFKLEDFTTPPALWFYCAPTPQRLCTTETLARADAVEQLALTVGEPNLVVMSAVQYERIRKNKTIKVQRVLDHVTLTKDHALLIWIEAKPVRRHKTAGVGSASTKL